MDAILLAGGVPSSDSPLYPDTQGKPKAILDIGGKPMIQWVIEALDQASLIDTIVIVGCEEYQNKFHCSKPMVFTPARGDMLTNFQHGVDVLLEQNPTAKNAAVVSSDIPMLTPEGVDWVVSSSLESDDDLYYCVINQKVMEARFPESSRTFIKLKDINVCGGDLAIIKLSLYTANPEFWKRIIQARKNIFRQASLIGIDILLLLVLRQITLKDAIRKVTRRLKITGQGLNSPFAEIGMDIDKPDQLEIARRELG